MEHHLDVNAMARSVLDANRRVGTAGPPQVAYDYTCPSTQTYPFRGTGTPPSMRLRWRATTPFTIVVDSAGSHTLTAQPPVLPLAVECVWQAGRDERWVEEVLPDLVDVMSWWHTRRDVTNTGLVLTFRPDESGLDMSPKYDVLLGITSGLPDGGTPVRWHAAMRELFAAYGAGRDPDEDLSRHALFAWQDVLVNSIYASSARALARLLLERGRTDAAAEWQQIAARTMAALLRDCWDETSGAFYDTYLGPAERHGVRRAQVKILTACPLGTARVLRPLRRDGAGRARLLLEQPRPRHVIAGRLEREAR